jgi:hypothetical protein
MSLLDDDRPTNPAKHFIQVKNGALSYYDKEEGKDVEVPTPLRFVVLDTLSTVKGWSAEQETGIWSNEVKSVGKEVLNVRTRNGIIASGLWKDIKDELKADGAKYHASIYIAAKGRDGLEIQNLSLKGSAVNAWIEFAKKHDLRQNAVVLADWEQMGKAVKYKVPVFEAVPMEDGERDEAVDLATTLKEYHDQYFSYNPDAHNESQVKQKDVVVEDIDEDEPINLDDIPF